MRLLFSIFDNPFCPRERYIWVQIRVLHETQKAILIDNAVRMWIPKSKIKDIRKKNGNIEIYVREGVIG